MGESQGQNRTWENRSSGIVGGPEETWLLVEGGTHLPTKRGDWKLFTYKRARFRSIPTANSGTIQRKWGMFKKAVQQGRRVFGEWSVHGVREYAQSPRTQVGAFFNLPRKGSEDLAISSEPAVDPANLGQAPRPKLNFVFFGIEFRVGMSHGVFEI